MRLYLEAEYRDIANRGLLGESGQSELPPAMRVSQTA